jgi:hypothetical protein
VLHEGLLAKAAQAKLLRTSRLRADTTVVPANESCPWGPGRPAKAVRRIAATGQRIEAAGGAPGPDDRPQPSAGKRAHAITAKLGLRFVLDHALEQGNRAGAPQLAPAAERVIKRTGRWPRTVPPTAASYVGKHIGCEPSP